MNTRTFLNVVHTALVDAHGAEWVDEMLTPAEPEEYEDRTAAVLALGGEIVHA